MALDDVMDISLTDLGRRGAVAPARISSACIAIQDCLIGVPTTLATHQWQSTSGPI